jgi:hypothetical protein
MRRLEGGGCNFVLYKMGCLKDVTREARASQVKDLEKLLEDFVTIIGEDLM